MMKTSVVFLQELNRPQQCPPKENISAESATQHTGDVCVTKLFQNWKKATERMNAHKRSSLHTQASQALLVISKQGPVVQQVSVQMMGALISRQWRNYPFSVIGRKKTLLSNGFWTFVCQVYRRQNSSG